MCISNHEEKDPYHKVQAYNILHEILLTYPKYSNNYYNQMKGIKDQMLNLYN